MEKHLLLAVFLNKRASQRPYDKLPTRERMITIAVNLQS
jgi:hypothetical protein